MIKFEFSANGSIVVTPELCLIEEFVDILKWDTTDAKLKASNVFKFVYYLCDMASSNEYRDLPENIKEDTVMKAIYGDKKTKFTKREKELVDACIETYLLLNNIPEERVLDTFDKKADEMRIVLEDTKPITVENESNGVITYDTNTAIITKGLKELNKTKSAKIAIMNVVRQEEGGDKVRGKAVLSPLSLGRISIPNITDLMTGDYEDS